MRNVIRRWWTFVVVSCALAVAPACSLYNSIDAPTKELLTEAARAAANQVALDGCMELGAALKMSERARLVASLHVVGQTMQLSDPTTLTMQLRAIDPKVAPYASGLAFLGIAAIAPLKAEVRQSALYEALGHVVAHCAAGVQLVDDLDHLPPED